MFDEVFFENEWIEATPCPDCGQYLSMIMGDVRCLYCDIDYTVEKTTLYKREEVN